MNSNYTPNGIRTRGVWDAKSKKFYAQETLPGPKKFKEEIETLKIDRKPKDVLAHPHVERKFWPKVVLGRSESGATKPVGKGTPRGGVGGGGAVAVADCDSMGVVDDGAEEAVEAVVVLVPALPGPMSTAAAPDRVTSSDEEAAPPRRPS